MSAPAPVYAASLPCSGYGPEAEPVPLDGRWTAGIYREWSFPRDVIEWWQQMSDRQGDVGLFVSPGWLEQWWAAWGTPGNLFTIVLRENTAVRAVFPCFLDRTDGLDAIRTLAVEVYHDLLCEDEALPRLAQLMETRLRRYALQFDFLSERSAAKVEQAFRSRRFPTWSYSEAYAPYLDVRGSWEEYVSSLRADFLSQLRRKHRRAERDGPLELQIHRGAEGLQELLTEAIDIEGRSWKSATGFAIGQRPQQERFVRIVSEWAAAHDKLRFVVLRHKGRMVAFDLDFEHAGTVFLLKTSYEVEAAQHSPGQLLRWELLRRGFEDGAFRRYNCLGRCDDYKMIWASQTETCHWVSVYPRTLSGRWRYLRLHAWKEALKRLSFVHRMAARVHEWSRAKHQ